LRFLQAQPDRRLVELAREGHGKAFEALLHRYRSELLGYCRRLAPRSGSAEDNLQQALLLAWKALSSGAEVRDFRPWIYRIIHNVAISDMRTPVTPPHELQETAGLVDLEELVQQRFEARAALASMASLPELQRQAFISSTLDGASHEEVAQALGLSHGAVRGLIYRARATMRSAAAAVTPSPVLHWALRHTNRSGARTGMAEALAGGGGAGLASLLVKGGAVLTLAGAVAGAGGVVLTQHHWHHHLSSHRTALTSVPPRTRGPALSRTGRGSVQPAARTVAATPATLRNSAIRRDGSSRGGPGPSSGSDGGLTGGSSGSSDGGSHDATSGSMSGTSGSSDGGSSSGGTTTSSSGSSDGVSGSTGGGSGPDGGTSGAQTTTTTTISSSDSGSSSGSDGGSGSGDVTTTTTETH
jgi:RNA polymerase sigma factor (sigma-70 family)